MEEYVEAKEFATSDQGVVPLPIALKIERCRTTSTAAAPAPKIDIMVHWSELITLYDGDRIIHCR